MAIDWDSQKFKRSAKGVKDSSVLTYEDFKSVVYESRIINVKNVSIRTHNRKMATVETEKIGLKNLFVKGVIDDDCVTVHPHERCTKILKK